ncbi:hypothetical protein GCM10009602_56200 [Nocardiopsis tropica]
MLQGGVAVVDHVDGHGLAAQPDRDGVGQDSFVFDHEYAHVVPLKRWYLEEKGPLPAHPPTHRQRRSWSRPRHPFFHNRGKETVNPSRRFREPAAHLTPV